MRECDNGCIAFPDASHMGSGGLNAMATKTATSVGHLLPFYCDSVAFVSANPTGIMTQAHLVELQSCSVCLSWPLTVVSILLECCKATACGTVLLSTAGCCSTFDAHDPLLLLGIESQAPLVHHPLGEHVLRHLPCSLSKSVCFV